MGNRRGMRHGEHAVVVGASMAGLAAARVLSDHFARVTVIDRDDLADAPPLAEWHEARHGVPQGRHAHGLLAAGEVVLAELFPGIIDDLVSNGARRGDNAEGIWFMYGGMRRRESVGIPLTLASRPLLEATVRRHLRQLPNVTLRGGCTVSGAVGDAAGRRVVGVRLLADDQHEVTMSADLLVDATGRAAHSVRWLEALGYAKPQVTTVSCDVGYASRVYRRPASDDTLLLLTAPEAPDEKRMGVLFPLEGDRWMCTLGGWFGDHPPTDPAGFEAFAATLPSPAIADKLRNAEPLTGIVTHKLASNQRRRFERCPALPAGLVALGDALCSFNPIYGQGMTSALLQARALADAIAAEGPTSAGLPGAFYRRASKAVNVPWMMATMADFAYPEAVGRRPLGTRLLNRYISRVGRAAHRDATVNGAFFAVQNLLVSPLSLLAPTVLWRTLRSKRQAPDDRAIAAPRQVSTDVDSLPFRTVAHP